MTYVVAEPCIQCKFTDCVAVCPADCFHEGKNYLVIDPAECIDCGACEPECPSSAIYAEDALPAEWADYARLNAALAQEWPVIAAKRDALPGADRFKDMKNKRKALELAPGP